MKTVVSLTDIFSGQAPSVTPQEPQLPPSCLPSQSQQFSSQSPFLFRVQFDQISRFTEIANRRVQQFEAVEQLEDLTTSTAFTAGGGGGGGTTNSAISSSSDGKFAKVEAEINGLLGETACEVVGLSRDTPLSGTVSSNGYKYYRVSLPPKPVQVKVEVTSTSSTALSLYGSLEVEKPTARTASLRGRDGCLTYMHALENQPLKDDSDANADHVDRRYAVPPYSDLFVAVHGLPVESCDYSITCSFVVVKIVLTREEMVERVNKIHNKWESHLNELRGDPQKRQGFEEKIQTIINERKEVRLRKASVKCLTTINRNEAAQLTPLRLHQQLVSRAIQRREKQHAVQERRHELAAELLARNQNYLNRTEFLRRKRKEEEEMNRKKTEKLTKLKNIFTAFSVFSTMIVQQAQRQQMAEEERQRNIREKVVPTIQYAWRFHLARRRRRQAYLNATLFRTAILLMSRHIHLVEKHLAANFLRAFLYKLRGVQNFSESILYALQLFVRRIHLVRRLWNNLKERQRARVEAYEHAWRRWEPYVVAQLARRFKQIFKRHGWKFGKREEKRELDNTTSTNSNDNNNRYYILTENHNNNNTTYHNEEEEHETTEDTSASMAIKEFPPISSTASPTLCSQPAALNIDAIPPLSEIREMQCLNEGETAEELREAMLPQLLVREELLRFVKCQQLDYHRTRLAYEEAVRQRKKEMEEINGQTENEGKGETLGTQSSPTDIIIEPEKLRCLGGFEIKKDEFCKMISCLHFLHRPNGSPNQSETQSSPHSEKSSSFDELTTDGAASLHNSMQEAHEVREDAKAENGEGDVAKNTQKKGKEDEAGEEREKAQGEKAEEQARSRNKRGGRRGEKQRREEEREERKGRGRKRK